MPMVIFALSPSGTVALFRYIREPKGMVINIIEYNLLPTPPVYIKDRPTR